MFIHTKCCVELPNDKKKTKKIHPPPPNRMTVFTNARDIRLRQDN